MKVFLVGAFLQSIAFLKAILGMFREPDIWCTYEQLVSLICFFLILLWGYRSSKKRVQRAKENPEKNPLVELIEKYRQKKKNKGVVAGYMEEFVEDVEEFVEDEDEFLEDEDEFVEDEKDTQN